MNCEEFEQNLADALGDELATDVRAEFDAHLSTCERCRQEYESNRQTVTLMSELPGPRRVRVSRQGDRLVIDRADADGLNRDDSVLRRAWTMRVRAGLLRYAASILIAFTAGYALHAGLMVVQSGRVNIVDNTSQQVEPVAPSRGEGGLRTAITSDQIRNPRRSGLASCLVAVAKSGR